MLQALGCVLFVLCFKEHPFEDSAKLRILNAKYNIPTNITDYEVLHDLISKCMSCAIELFSRFWNSVIFQILKFSKMGVTVLLLFDNLHILSCVTDS